MNIADINAEARSWCDADTTSYIAADLLRRVNDAYETVVNWIISADGTWQFDDLNYTTLPIGTQTLVEGQTAYSFSTRFLSIEAVEVLSLNGQWTKLIPIDPQELGYQTIEEFAGITASSTPKGLPQYYDKASDTIKLYPAPTATSVTLTNGLRVRFNRTADLFTSAQVITGTKEPGFAIHHIVLAYMAARPYCMSYKKDRVAELNMLIGDMTAIPSGLKKGILDHYSRRQRDVRKVATTKRINFR